MDLNEGGGATIFSYTRWKTKKRKHTGGKRLKEREGGREYVKSKKFNWLSSVKINDIAKKKKGQKEKKGPAELQWYLIVSQIFRMHKIAIEEHSQIQGFIR